jgi:hypothetical protein
MLMAYEDDDGFQIKDLGMEAPRIPVHSIVNYSDAVRTLEKAQNQRPDVRWEMVGGGPYRVHEKC